MQKNNNKTLTPSECADRRDALPKSVKILARELLQQEVQACITAGRIVDALLDSAKRAGLTVEAVGDEIILSRVIGAAREAPKPELKPNFTQEQ